MDYKLPLETYTGKVKEIVLGKGNKELKIGGQSILSLHYFEGNAPNKPVVALQIDDNHANGWAEWILEPYKDVVDDPVEWASRCLELGADLVCLHLDGTDPKGLNRSAEEAAILTKKICSSIDCPLIVYGCGNEKKDVEVLTKVAEECNGERILMGPAVKENYEAITHAVAENEHLIIAQTPLDINLEKELNVKLLKQLSPDRIVIDPLSSALGYGMEYSFTIMERTRQVAIVYGDTTMQMPIIANLGAECWKTNQARSNRDQGIMWECITAISLLLAGADILVVRHPDNCMLIKEVIDGKI